MIRLVDKRTLALLTSATILTVGKVVAIFCGCGGRIVTGQTPLRKSQIDSTGAQIFYTTIII